jgi:hypothetical protein
MGECNGAYDAYDAEMIPNGERGNSLMLRLLCVSASLMRNWRKSMLSSSNHSIGVMTDKVMRLNESRAGILSATTLNGGRQL